MSGQRLHELAFTSGPAKDRAKGRLVHRRSMPLIIAVSKISHEQAVHLTRICSHGITAFRVSALWRYVFIALRRCRSSVTTRLRRCLPAHEQAGRAWPVPGLEPSGGGVAGGDSARGVTGAGAAVSAGCCTISRGGMRHPSMRADTGTRGRGVFGGAGGGGGIGIRSSAVVALTIINLVKPAC
jgi:hypothetical protein